MGHICPHRLLVHYSSVHCSKPPFKYENTSAGLCWSISPGAFPQADADCEVYMNILAGFMVDKGQLCFTYQSAKEINKVFVLKIHKNIYGLRQARNVWFDRLHSGFLQYGFIQSLIDPCLFYRKDCIFITYVNDCLLFSASDYTLDSLIQDLQKDFKLTYEGDVGAYLGIVIHHHSNGTLELVQPGLIAKIIQAAGLDANSAQHDTPATSILHADSSGPECEHMWNYHALIGMLNSLASSSHLDIAFAIHQCACSCTAPK